MDPERWQRIKGIFQAAVERPPAAREALLAEACADDPTLQEHLRELLEAHETTADHLAEGALAALPELQEELSADVLAGMHVGPYRLLSELGRGGMGAVYLANRDDGTFEQHVALKLIKRGMDTDEIVQRFVHERQILAALTHPYIARLLDGGTTADGRPYFVMEHVDGQPITAWARAAGLPLEERLRLFLKVCSAVQFAHQNLVVHRDLKPANILVGADGDPKLLDFGIAKLLGSARPGWTQTASAAQPLTPDYASPEQLAGQPVTTTTDVHGLGLLLYELLVGQSPAAVGRHLGTGWRSRPASQAAAALAKAGGAAAAPPVRRLSRDLDTIVGKALAADPAARYGTARELADDIERHLSRRPVKARRPTLVYLFGRAVLRHRVAAAFALSFVVFSLAVTWQAFELDRQRRRAEGTTRFLTGLFKASDPGQNRGAEIRARDILDSGARLLLHGPRSQPPGLLRELGDLAAEPETRADLLSTIGEVQANLGLRAEAERSLLEARKLHARRKGRDARLAEAQALAALGQLYLEGSRYEESRRVYEEALRLRQNLLGRRALPVAEVVNGLGIIAYETDDLKKAGELLREALDIRREGGEAGRVGVAGTLANLGLVALDEARFPQAIQHLEDSLKMHRELMGEDHPDSIRVLSNLATVHYKNGDFVDAEKTLRAVLRIRQRVLGDHPDVVRTWSSLAAVAEIRGRLQEAAAWLREALAMRQRLSLTEDEDYANALSSLASVQRKRGDLAAAAPLAEHSLRLYRRLLGEEHPSVVNALNSQALIELDRGALASAEAKVRQGLAIRRKAYGSEHPSVASSLHQLALVLRQGGRTAEAEAAFRQALDLRLRLLKPDHPFIADNLVDLGSLLVEQGRSREAEPLLEQALAILRRSPTAGPLSRSYAEGQLGACYQALGRVDEARPLLTGSHRTLASLLGDQNPQTREIARFLRRLPPTGS